MPISEAKLAANRRNAQKSTGPRTDEGKEKAKMNATKHGLRAETLIVLEEDPQVLDDRRAAWRDCLLPGDDVEERLVESAVVHTWMQDRARRAQASRINANITNYGVDQDQTTEEEVVALGRRLFKDRLGPLVSYPTGANSIGTYQCRSATTSYAGQRDDPDVPIDLVLRLQSTLLGCEWLLAEWARLKTILDQGQPWVASDKLKAVRLLGKQPFDAIDDKDVAMMFLASFVLKGHSRARWDWEISMEMNSEEIDTFRKNAATRQLDSLIPSDTTKAREALLEIIERVTQRLTTRADAHRERARVMAVLATDFLAFDDSPGGERLRRYDLASGRGLSRALDDLRKHRHSFVRGPLSVVSGPLSVVSGPLSVVCCQADAVTEPIATNEPTAARENVTNETTAAGQNATNEPTAAGENATNEATASRENVTNEPTVARENVTNEPNLAADSVHILGADPSASTSVGSDESLRAEVDSQESAESYWQGVARRKAAREERTRQLNEEAHREAERAMTVRRALLGERKRKTAQPRNQPNGRVARACPTKTMENDSRKKRKLDELVKTVDELYEEAVQSRSHQWETGYDGEPVLRNETTIDKLSVVSGPPLSVVRGPSSVVGSAAEALTEAIATNEPTIGPWSVVSSPLLAVSCTVESVVEPSAPNEPTAGLEKAPNEATAGGRGSAAPLKTAGGSRPEIDANGGVVGLVGREADPDPDAEIEKVEARKRLGDETVETIDKPIAPTADTSESHDKKNLETPAPSHDQEIGSSDSCRASAEQLAAKRFARWREQKLRRARGAGVIESPCPTL